jgi:mRNA-degrading endonuclease RelE of RelBE toxin-antitoxin system
MTMKIRYSAIASFEKDLKRLGKRYNSLASDIEEAKVQVLEAYHVDSIDSRATFPIPGFCFENVIICKLKKFACKSLKGRGNRSGIRIIYAFYPQDPKIEFIEIYFKADQTNEDKERIKDYLKQINVF